MSPRPQVRNPRQRRNAPGVNLFPEYVERIQSLSVTLARAVSHSRCPPISALAGWIGYSSPHALGCPILRAWLTRDGVARPHRIVLDLKQFSLDHLGMLVRMFGQVLIRSRNGRHRRSVF